MKQFDVVALGELLVDFTRNGESGQGNPLFEANPGGAPANVLAMLQKLGKKTAFIGKVGQDGFGNLLSDTVKNAGVDVSGLKRDPEIPTTLAIVNTFPNGDRDFSFYRKPGADLLLSYGYPVSAHYIYLSMFFTFATLYPDMQVLLFFIIPIKMKWLALVDAAFFVYSVVTSPFPINLLPIIAVLNYLIFCGGWLVDAARRLLGGKTRQQRRSTVNFQNEVRRMQQEQKQKTYTRRCEVCGRTDTDYPDLEFRYCSRCQGYHCFCMDHINNHRHFTE